MGNTKNLRVPTFCDRFAEIVGKCGGINNAAEIIGIKRQTVSLWYNGSRVPDALNLSRIATGFGVSVDYLLGLVDQPTPDVAIQGIYNLTGLRAESVEKLTKLYSGKTTRNYATLLNQVIADVDFEKLLATLHSYLLECEAFPPPAEVTVAYSPPFKNYYTFVASTILRDIMERVSQQEA